MSGSHRLYQADSCTLSDFEEYKSLQKREMGKMEQAVRDNLADILTEIDTKVSNLRKTIEHKLRDAEGITEEKLRLMERKLFENVNERSYANHERHFEMGDTLKEKALENRLRNTENRLDRLESGNNGPLSARQSDKKFDYLEEKLIETTEIAIRAEKKCIDLELETRTALERINIRHERDEPLSGSRRNVDSYLESKIHELSDHQEKIDKKIQNQFAKMKAYMAETNELLKSQSSELQLVARDSQKVSPTDVRIKMEKLEKNMHESVKKEVLNA